MASGCPGRLATGRPGARHRARPAWRGFRSHGRRASRAAGAGAGRERARGFAPCAFPGGAHRGAGQGASPRARCFPPRPGFPYTRPGNHTAGKSHEASAAVGPVHGLRAAGQARADRRRGPGSVAPGRRGDPHTDRADGGDAARFAAAAAAYTAIRTGFGRAEEHWPDLAPPAGPLRWRPARAARRAAAGPRAAGGRPPMGRDGAGGRLLAGLVAGRWWSRVRRGRPARLALRIAAAAAVSVAVALVGHGLACLPRPPSSPGR